MRPAILLFLSAVFSFAQTNRFHVSQHVGADSALILIKTDLSTGQSWRYDDSYQGIEIVASEAGQKVKEHLEKLTISHLDSLESFTLTEAVSVLSRAINQNDLEKNTPKSDGPLKRKNLKEKNQSKTSPAVIPNGASGAGVRTNAPPTMLPAGTPGGGIGTVPVNSTIDPVTGLPIGTPPMISGVVGGAPGGVPGVGIAVPGVSTNMIPGGIPGGLGTIPVSPIPGIPGAGGGLPGIPGAGGGIILGAGGLPGRQFNLQPAGFPIFILSGTRSRYATTRAGAMGIDPITGIPIGPSINSGPIPGIDPSTGLPVGRGGIPGARFPGRKPKANSADDNKTDSALPPGAPPGGPSSESPRVNPSSAGGGSPGLGEPGVGVAMGGGLPGMGGGLPGMGGGLPGMGGGLPAMGDDRPRYSQGIDPDEVKIKGMVGGVVNINAFAALHLVLSLADEPLQCAIDGHGVFIFPPSEPFRFLDGNKPKFSETGRWVKIGGSE